MQKAINRFWDWLFHPGIRWYHYPKGKSAWFRYPSPGNIIPKQDVPDYKSPFQYSQYNIRYRKPVPTLSDPVQPVYFGDGPQTTVQDKLRVTKLLKPGNNTQQQIQQAKKKFLQIYGFPVEQKVAVSNVDLKIPQGTNRQSYRQYIQTTFKNTAQQAKYIASPNYNRRFIQQPQICRLESLDMFSMPHFQQARIQVNYKLDNYARQNAKRGYIEIRKGQRSFWKAIDNSNDPKNIQRVQRATGDQQPNNFTLRNTKIQFQLDDKGDVTDVNPKTKGI